MKALIFVLCLASASALLKNNSASGCEGSCPAIYTPICAQGVDSTWAFFENECQFNNCGGNATYPVSCNTLVTSDGDCSC